MYQALLTRRYLTSKITPLLAVFAVLLCTAMVLVVWSVMGGFLTTLLGTGRTLYGDVSIAWPVQGIPHYERLIERLEADPLTASAAPVIDAPGLLKLPGGSILTVQVTGVEGASFDEVTGFHDALWWRPIEDPLPKDEQRDDPRLDIAPRFLEEGARLTEADPDTGEGLPAVVPGIEVTRYAARQPGGWYTPRYGFLPNEEVTLSVLPLSQRGVAIDVEAQRFPVANEFRTGFYEFDAGKVFVRLDALQAMLGMDAAQRTEAGYDFGVETDESGQESFVEPTTAGAAPARVTGVLLRAAEGVSPDALRDKTEDVYLAFYEDMRSRGMARDLPTPDFIQIATWEERPGVRSLVAAVKKETALVLALFGFISLTAVFLVFSIFWAMVSEKTKDVGVLRALGASRAGVAWLFLRYGLMIGVVGSALGGLTALAIVWNINPIHEWLGEALGIYVWDPSVYYFTEIPSDMDPAKAAIVLACGVLFSVAGALTPAVKAANLDPVRSLRFE